MPARHGRLVSVRSSLGADVTPANIGDVPAAARIRTVPPESGEHYGADRAAACWTTASNIATVRRPVNVFCWLGW